MPSDQEAVLTMYAEIKSIAGKTKNGTYKNTNKYDKERLVWDQWIDIGKLLNHMILRCFLLILKVPPLIL